MPNCWICGCQADSAEHMVKASDFRAAFGSVTQANPAYRHSVLAKNEPIRGANADILKFRRSLCSHCNNARTQPHDRAWEALLDRVCNGLPVLGRRDLLPLGEIFGVGSEAEGMLNAHLFFLKQLGCHAVENSIPLPLNHIALCILNSVPYPDIYLTFVSVAPQERTKVWVGDIETLSVGTTVVSAKWFYVVDRLGVYVILREPGRPNMISARGWNPNDTITAIRLQ